MSLLSALALALAGPSLQEHGSEWIADFDRAAALAREQKKDLLVDFTGSDW